MQGRPRLAAYMLAMPALFRALTVFLLLAAARADDPFWPGPGSPRLTTPQWLGEAGVDAVVVLAIDDLRIESVPKYEAFMRPFLDHLKRSQGRAPVSILTNTVDPGESQLKAWLAEGLNLDVHTSRHPCPLLNEKGFLAARDTVFECLDLLSSLPGNRPVGFRMPCCDSLSSPSPRFYAEIFPQTSPLGRRLRIDSSVMNLITPADAELPRALVLDAAGKDRFAKYFPGSRSDGPYKQKSLKNFGTYIENHPYPYPIKGGWELPCVVPSDWEAYNVLDKAHPQLLEDWKAALDAIVLKRGVFTLVFHPHGWCTSEQVLQFIRHAESRYGPRVRFMNFAEVEERLAKVDPQPWSPPARPAPKTPLPELARHGGVRFVDLNADGHDDLVVSNPQGYGVYLFNPVEKKNVQWEVGWTNVLREGRAGDANSLPLIVRADGTDNGVWFKHGAMWVQNEDTAALPDKVRHIPYADLLRVPGPAPMSPQESLRALRAKPGHALSLVAHEPLVQDPVFADWDERGRLWVVEMGDYPFAPGEKTQNGAFGQGRVSDLQTGRVKILEDADGDGVYDRATLFLDGLTHPTGLAFWKGGVFVASIPDIFFAEDTDGDGRCDRRETWFSGFTAGNPQHLVNGFCWGLDGWLHGANGDSGGDITCHKTGKKLALGTHDFRFHPETGVFELETGRSQFGKWRDDYGNWFGNNNSVIGWHYHVPMRYLERHPERVAASVRSVLNADKTVHPVSPPLRRFNWASAINTLTSGCSPVPWHDGRDDLLLVCEPANNLVHRELLDYTTFPITSRRHPDDAGSEFLASTDNWFRPALAREGPDGAIYVVDTYRLVLEHPEWIPLEIAKGLDLRAGEDKGRIYRVEPPGRKPVRPDWQAFETLDGRVAALGSANRWQRDTAQRLLLQLKEPAALPALRALAGRPGLPTAARVQVLWTLQLLQGGPADTLVAALQAAHPKVRGAALVAAGSDAIDPRELASWFPKAQAAQPVAQVPVLTRVSADRQTLVGRYTAEVAKLQGDAKRGEAVFQKACMACHQLGGQGVEVGPDLATVAAKPVEQILEAIFDPNRAVELRNAATQITQTDGSLLVGLIAAETPGAITLKLPGGVEMPVPRARIRETRTLSTSLMPEGLESVVSTQDAADLLARLRGR